MLRGSAWGQVLFFALLDQLESGRQQRGELGTVVPARRKPRTRVGSILRERRDDHGSQGVDSTVEDFEVPASIGGVHEEVEGGAVVPEAVGPGWRPGKHVLPQPGDPLSERPEPTRGLRDRRLSDVEHREVSEGALEQLAGERRGAPSDIDNRLIAPDTERVDQFEREPRLVLKPAQAATPLRVDIVPIRARDRSSLRGARSLDHRPRTRRPFSSSTCERNQR
jgi:hypothetical protein